MYKISKKAEEMYLSWVNVLVWVIIGLFVLIGIYFYNSSETDIRTEEARILNQKITNCLVEYDSSLKQNVDETLDIFQTCSLDKNLFENELLFFAKIELFPAKEQISETPVTTLAFGNTEFDVQCSIDDKKFPQCYSQKIFVYDSKTNENFLLKIKTGSNNEGEK